MSALAQRSNQPSANDSEWLEFPDRFEISPASVWAPDYEEEITLQSKRVAAKRLEQVTAGTVDEPSVNEAHPRARILDESQVLPSEASFATVRLNQPLEPAVVKGRGQVTANRVEEFVSQAGPPTRILDDSQVLPGEASFATVRLNQPLEPTAVKGRGQVTANRVEEFVNQASPPTRILDDSQVLPGEASFATVMLNAPIAARTYSPLAEFSAKSNLAWRRLAVIALLSLSISFVITLLILKATEVGGFSTYPTANTPADVSRPQPQPTAAQTELITPNAQKAGSVSDGEKQISGPMAAPVGAAELKGAVEVAHDRLPKAANSERSRNAASVDAKLKTSRNIASQNAKSVASKAATARESGKRRLPVSQRQASVQEAVIRKEAAPIERGDVNSSSSETDVRHRESSSWSGNAAAAQPKGEVKSAPATGGGQRPRSVTRRVNP